MKSIFLLLVSIFITWMLPAQISKTIHLTAGSLDTVLTAGELGSVTQLTLTGTMDARDFRTIRIKMLSLKELDIREVAIEAYTTNFENEDQVVYSANSIPTAHSWNADHLTKYSLAGHPSLSIIKLPVSLISIGDWAFKYCPRLTYVEMQSSVTYIGMYAFYRCPLLGSINFSPTVNSIGEEAFEGCSSLTSIQLPPALSAIAAGTFKGCESLKTVDIPESVTYIGAEAFAVCMDLQSVVIPSSVTMIGTETFYLCSSLSSVLIPPSVTVIGMGAFIGCSSLTTLTIPRSVTDINSTAFYDCINLQSIDCQAVTPPKLHSDQEYKVFYNVDKDNCLLRVPFGTNELYSQADEWKDFKNIVEMPGFSLSANSLSF